MGLNDGGTIRASHATGDAATTLGGNAGGLVGSNFGSATISGCYAMGNAEAITYGGNVGGLVGWNTISSTIRASYATGNAKISGNNDGAGGLAGQNNGFIRACYATGNATTAGNDSDAVGELFGLVNNQQRMLVCE